MVESQLFDLPLRENIMDTTGDIINQNQNQENTTWDDVVQNHDLITNIHDPSLDQFMVELQPSDWPLRENIMDTTREIINQNQDNTMWDDIAQNHGLITSIHEPTLDMVMVQSQPTNFTMRENTMVTTREIINQNKNQVIFKNHKQKTKIDKHMRKNTHSKKTNIIKSKWTQTEDRILMRMVELYGTKKWTMIAKMFEGRIGKQCRDRWHNHLSPNIKKNTWTEEENNILIEAHKIAGNKWTEIARYFQAEVKIMLRIIRMPQNAKS